MKHHGRYTAALYTHITSSDAVIINSILNYTSAQRWMFIQIFENQIERSGILL